MHAKETGFGLEDRFPWYVFRYWPVVVYFCVNLRLFLGAGDVHFTHTVSRFIMWAYSVFRLPRIVKLCTLIDHIQEYFIQPDGGMRGALEFSVLRFWPVFRSVVRFSCPKISVFRFSISLWFADFSFFSTWFSVFVKYTSGFSVLVSDVVFSFLILCCLGSVFSLLWAEIDLD